MCSGGDHMMNLVLDNAMAGFSLLVSERAYLELASNEDHIDDMPRLQQGANYIAFQRTCL
ncbi:unnamed protein product [Camellia sinensis]